MKFVAMILLLGMVLLTGCGAKAEPVSTTVTTETTEQIQIPTTIETETMEQLLEIELTEDRMKDPYGVAVNSQAFNDNGKMIVVNQLTGKLSVVELP